MKYLWRYNSGMAIPIIICIILLSSIFFLTVSFLTQNQQHAAKFYFDSENALYIAEATSNEIFSFLRSVNFPNEDRPGMQKLYKELFEKPAGQEAKSVKLEPGPEIERYLIDFSKVSPLKIQATAFLSKFCALQLPESNPGFKLDPTEKEGLIKLEIRVEFGKAVKVLNRIHKIKITRITHPVLSRFSLFVKNAPSSPDRLEKINPLHQNFSSLKASANSYFLKNSNRPCAPIILDNGNIRNLAPQGKYSFSSLNKDIKQLAEKNALIFLGGEDKWKLGLGGGAPNSKYSERFLTRLAAYDIYHMVRIMSEKAKEKGYLSPLPEVTIQGAYISNFGMEDDIAFKDSSVVPLEKTQAYQFYKDLDDNIPIAKMKGSSAFRLFGSVKNFSPTIVMGNVARFYRKQIALDCRIWGKTFKDVTMPYLDEDKFKRLSMPSFINIITNDAKTANTLKGVSKVFGLRVGNAADISFALDYYSKIFRSDIQKEHYMRALDFVLTNKETGTYGQELTKGNKSPPIPPNGQIYKDLQNKRIEIEAPISSTSPEARFSGQNVNIKIPAGETIFKGDLADINFFDDMTLRTSMQFETFKDFSQRCIVGDSETNKRLILPSNVFVKRKGLLAANSFKITKPLIIERGGTIVIDGPVYINAGIEAPTSEPLTIVSSDKIQIGTSEEIAASLYACKGIFKTSNIDGFKINGTVAAAKIDTVSLVKGPTPKYISYSNNFDELLAKEHDPYFPKRISLSDEFRQYYGKAY
ncbi:MAG: hypothetical protein ACQETH_09240 [Candidatus Rifleibacteriota bacterium]